MSMDEADHKAAKIAADDRGENPSAMEPLVLSEGSRHRGRLSDMAVELAAATAGFRRSLPTGIVAALADLVRAMNCYYSNLIEGHYTHPVDIERAMNSDYSADPEKRNLQLEARAHVVVRHWIDQGGVRGKVFADESLREAWRFSELLPDELLVVSDPDTSRKVTVVAGELRQDDVKVERHLAPSPGAVPRFMARFEEVYGRLGRSEQSWLRLPRIIAFCGFIRLPTGTAAWPGSCHTQVCWKRSTPAASGRSRAARPERR